MMKQQGRRVARLRVDPEIFLQMCMATDQPRVTWVVENAIPPGAKLVAANFDNITGRWELGIEHYSFKPVPPELESPLLPPVAVRSSLGAYQRMETALGTAEAALTNVRDRIDGWLTNEDAEYYEIASKNLRALADYVRDVCQRLAGGA